MTPQSLKSAILQLAIQGKLVPQRPEDGVARVPAALNTEKRKARRHGEEIAPPFEIPESWRWVLLPQVADILYGFPFDSQQFNDLGDGMPLIRIRDVLPAKTKTFTTESCPPRYLIHNGDMLVGMDGNFNVGFWQGGDAFLNQRVCKISASDNILSQKFLYHYLPFALEKIEKNASFVTVKHLSAKHLNTTLVPLPPLPEQHRIVAKIEELLPLVDRYEQAWTKLEDFTRRFPADMQKSLLQMAIQGHLVDQRPEEGTGEQLYRKILATKTTKKDKKLPPIANDEIPFEIPESWYWTRLGCVGSWGSGATPSRAKPEYYNGAIPWLKTGDLNDGYVSDTSEKITELALSQTSVRLNPVGSVLMAMYGATIGKLGIITVPMTTNQACCACAPYEGIYNRYLFFFLLARRQAFIKMGEGGAQPNISKEKIVNSLIPLPPFAEQKRIVAKLEELLPLCERLK